MRSINKLSPFQLALHDVVQTTRGKLEKAVVVVKVVGFPFLPLFLFALLSWGGLVLVFFPVWLDSLFSPPGSSLSHVLSPYWPWPPPPEV